jgi:5-(aminomethyl)-3-furanmethanol phosphate kinase
MAAPGLRVHTRSVPIAGAADLAVIKLGGSVVRTGDLSAWLDAISAAPRPIVVVPGGGALADEVRACQARLGFAEKVGHEMALLAMNQLALAVAGLRQGFAVGTTEAELRAAFERGDVAVWAPYGLIAGRADVEPSWRVTSDSLALWLAARIGAPRCFLIKSVKREAIAANAAELSRAGIVDAAFPAMLKETGVRAFFLGRGDQQALAPALACKEKDAGGWATHIV